ncbi:MAG: YgiT-type zinc finger protein [Euryarchaeota archaeon]|nr:YgiT-type zinc finger protein [Euryarchaeota archaeon]
MIVSKCAICSGKIEEREVSEAVRLGNDLVVVENVIADVCLGCGERHYPPGVVDRLGDIEMHAMDQEALERLHIMGHAYRISYGVPNSWYFCLSPLRVACHCIATPRHAHLAPSQSGKAGWVTSPITGKLLVL